MVYDYIWWSWCFRRPPVFCGVLRISLKPCCYAWWKACKPTESRVDCDQIRGKKCINRSFYDCKWRTRAWNMRQNYSNHRIESLWRGNYNGVTKLHELFSSIKGGLGIHLVRTQLGGRECHPKCVQLRTRGVGGGRGGIMHYVYVHTCIISSWFWQHKYFKILYYS